MSRFDDNFDSDLTVIAERVTPSPDAWASIQQRIADREPTKETEIIMLTDNTITRRRWPLVAAAAAVVALAITGIALVNRDDGADLPADNPTPTLAPAPEVVDSGAVKPLPAEGQALPPGRYSVATLGVPIEFDVPKSGADWRVDLNNPLAFTIAADAGFIGMTRIGSFYDAEQAQDPDAAGLGTIAPDDVDGWIEANGIIVDKSGESAVGGRSAEFRQVRVPLGTGDGLCPPEAQPCIKLESVSADAIEANPGQGSRLGGEFANSYWFVELGDFEPLGIWAYAFDGDMTAWLDEAAPIVDSMTLGEPGPAVEGGTARLSTFGDATSGELPEAGQQVAPGTYTTDAIGVSVTLDILDGQTGPWTIVTNDQTGIQLISDDTGREFMAIGRVGSWFDTVESRTEGTRGLGSIPADGVDTWIEANRVIVVDSAEVQVGGRDAKYRLIRLDTTPGATADFCPPGEAPCLWAASGSADLVDADSTPVPFGRDRVQALWSIDMGEFEPVFIFAAANLDDDGPWFIDTVQPIVDSIQFGEPAPVIPGGTARVPERVTVTSTMTGIRTEGAQASDGTFPIESASTLIGEMTGDLASTGVRTGNEVVEEILFTGAIDGLGTGTLTLRSRTGIGAFGAISITTTVVSGTGDFAGLTGRGTTTIGGDAEASGPFTATLTLELRLPAG